MHKNVYILTLAGALGTCVAPMVVFIGGIVGSELAPVPVLATLPVAAMVVGTAGFVLPISRAMSHFGRKPVFIANALWAALNACLASYAVMQANFYLFVFAVGLLGGNLAGVQQFRFASMESVHESQRPNAASIILLGGLVAAFAGPELAYWGRNLLDEVFAGSFLFLALTSTLCACVLCLYQPVEASVAEAAGAKEGRALNEILSNGAVWLAIVSATVGYAVMSYIMTATPVSMHEINEHSLVDTKWVIQSHICAMYLPSLFAGKFIQKFGVKVVMFSGLMTYLACIVIASAGEQVMHFWWALVLLGIGWNFLFVAGTTLLPQTHEPNEGLKVQGFNDLVVFSVQAAAALASGWVLLSVGWQILLWLALPAMAVQLALTAYVRLHTSATVQPQ